MEKTVKASDFFFLKTLFIIIILIGFIPGISSSDYMAYRTATPPVMDGVANEECWRAAKWAYINQPFDGKSGIPDSADFYGRYKVVWDASRLYVLMEVTDDKLVDNRVNPRNTYWDDDCAEFFIDEDRIPEGHECGTEAFNAFAYHIAAVARDKNNYLNGSVLAFDSPNAVNHVIDLGSDCNTNNAINLDDHVNVKIAKSGNKYIWELEFKIYDKNYKLNSSNTPVTLTAGKKMGFAIAYCDDDSGVRDNMVGTVSNHNDYNGPYPLYRFTNDFETLTLNDSVLSLNTAVKTPDSGCRHFLWPNPAKNTLSIRTYNDNQYFDEAEIYNLSGVVLSSYKLGNESARIDVSSLDPGIYLMQISNKEAFYKQLFIKE